MADPEGTHETEQLHKSPPEGEETGEEVRTTVTREDECRCTIRAEVDPDYLKRRYEERLDEFHQEAQVPGFRPGKAPTALVERRYGTRLREEVLSSVASEAYTQAVKENDLKVVAELDSPDIEQMEWQVGQPATFEFSCEVLPEVELDESQYKGLHVQVPRLEITEEMAEQELKRFALQLADWEEVQEGVIDWDDYVEAEVRVLDQEAGTEWSEEIGFRPRQERIGPFSVEGIKGALTGASPGDTVEVEAQLAADEEPEDGRLKGLAGETVSLEVNIKAAHRQNIPELNDELARKLQFDNVEGIRSFIRERLQNQLENARKEARRQSVLAALVRNVELEMPPSMVERATREMQGRLVVQALRSGVPLQEARQVAQENAEGSRGVALQNLKATLLLREIADQNRIYALDEEVQDQIQALASQQGWTVQRTQRYLEENDQMSSLRWELREDKTVQMIIDNAEIQEVDPERFSEQSREGQGKQTEETDVKEQ